MIARKGQKSRLGKLAGRSFDSDSRDETARVSAQDDGFYSYQELRLGLYVEAA
jgi:hypothetical protein